MHAIKLERRDQDDATEARSIRQPLPPGHVSRHRWPAVFENDATLLSLSRDLYLSTPASTRAHTLSLSYRQPASLGCRPLSPRRGLAAANLRASWVCRLDSSTTAQGNHPYFSPLFLSTVFLFKIIVTVVAIMDDYQ